MPKPENGGLYHYGQNGSQGDFLKEGFQPVEREAAVLQFFQERLYPNEKDDGKEVGPVSGQLAKSIYFCSGFRLRKEEVSQEDLKDDEGEDGASQNDGGHPQGLQKVLWFGEAEVFPRLFAEVK